MSNGAVPVRTPALHSRVGSFGKNAPRVLGRWHDLARFGTIWHRSPARARGTFTAETRRRGERSPGPTAPPLFRIRNGPVLVLNSFHEAKLRQKLCSFVGQGREPKLSNVEWGRAGEDTGAPLQKMGSFCKKRSNAEGRASRMHRVAPDQDGFVWQKPFASVPRPNRCGEGDRIQRTPNPAPSPHCGARRHTFALARFPEERPSQ